MTYESTLRNLATLAVSIVSENRQAAAVTRTVAGIHMAKFSLCLYEDLPLKW